MNKVIGIGVIGVGHRRYFLPELNTDNGSARITAIADIDEVALNEVSSKLPAEVFITKDYKELLKRDDVDAVVVLTPDHLHKEHAIATLKAGKHLFLEKPMALSIEDCDDIIEVWLERPNLKFMMCLNMRFMPMYQTMREIIGSGLIGDVKTVWMQHFVGRGGKMYFQDWHRNRKFTNSLLLQKGCHDIDMIHMLANSYTKKVSAFGGLDFYNDRDNFIKDGLVDKTKYKIDVEDNHVVIMELENGCKAGYMQCHFTPEYKRNYLIVGTKGIMESDDLEYTIKIKLNNGNDINYKINDTDIVHFGADKKIVEAFINMINGHECLDATPVDGRMSVAAASKAAESLRNGGVHLSVPKIELTGRRD